MHNNRIMPLRNTAAILAILSGSGQIAALWFRQLTEATLLDALLGAVYLIIGIGLFGQSRFTLFMAIAIPGAMSGFLLATVSEPGQVMTARIVNDGVLMLFSLVVLWQVRDNPST